MNRMCGFVNFLLKCAPLFMDLIVEIKIRAHLSLLYKNLVHSSRANKFQRFIAALKNVNYSRAPLAENILRCENA